MMNASREQIYGALRTLLGKQVQIFGNVYSGNVEIDGISAYDMTGLAVGMPIGGAGIPDGATIATVAINGYSITLSMPATASGNNVPLLVTLYNKVTNIVQEISTVPPDDRPVLIVIEQHEIYQPPNLGLPTIAILAVNVLIYIAVQIGAGVSGFDALNPRIAMLKRQLNGPPLTSTQTLGGLVNYCWIEGLITRVSGDLDGNGLAAVPVRIQVPA